MNSAYLVFSPDLLLISKLAYNSLEYEISMHAHVHMYYIYKTGYN